MTIYMIVELFNGLEWQCVNKMYKEECMPFELSKRDAMYIQKGEKVEDILGIDKIEDLSEEAFVSLEKYADFPLFYDIYINKENKVRIFWWE